MITLINIEWQKLKPYTFFWIFAGLYFFILFGALYITFHFLQSNALTNAPVSWHNITYIAGFFNFFLVLLVILYSTNEYQFNTYRQNVIDGLSRTQLFLSKLYINLLLAIYAVVVLAILFLLLNVLSNTSLTADVLWTDLYYLCYHLIKCFCLLSIAFFVSLVFKRGIISILLFIVMGFADVMLSSVIKVSFLELLPFSACGNLIVNPMAAMLPSSESTSPSITTTFYAVVFYCMSFNGLSFWWLTKKDLKG